MKIDFFRFSMFRDIWEPRQLRAIREKRDEVQRVLFLRIPLFFVFGKEAQVQYEVQYLIGIIVCIYEVPA